jgi:hypothetical protein
LWVTTNLIGAAGFLWRASSCCWMEPELRGIPGASAGDAFVWFSSAFPIFALFAVADLGWTALATIQSIRSRRWGDPITALGLTAAWAAVFVVDNLHHGV